MSKNPYKNFSKYILRTPLFSFSSYQELTAKTEISDEDFKTVCENPVVREALFLASPSLFEEMNRWLEGEKEDPKKGQKLRYSILKYISRMSSRCTPFGLFAGCSVGEFGEETAIELKGSAQNKRHTRLDMNYLVALSQDLVTNKKIREQLLFFPNSSIYKAGPQLRYIEYKYFNSRRHHHIVAVDDTEYLAVVLEKASHGASLSQLASLLVDDEISIEEATEFIEELVSSQLLISELEPSVSGPEFLDQICNVLERLQGVEDILKALKEADKKITKIDQSIGNNPSVYLELSEFLQQLDTDFELKFMFQTDMVLQNTKNTLSQSVVDDIQKGYALLNRLTFPQSTTTLTKFRDAFHERFEEREVPLSTALDVEIGIGYKQDQGAGDVNPLVDNIMIPGRQAKNPMMEVRWSSINGFMQQKLIDAFKNDDYVITLNADDFKDYDLNWDDLPDTMSCMIEILDGEDGQHKIKFSGGGGSSAANLLGRFCHGDQELFDYTQEMADMEAEMNKDKILAEIVHLPESRVGNILMRPDLRKYEIPYLAKSIKDEEDQLPIDDLMVSVKNHSKVLLRSKKYNKEVVPHLTNAHNYSANSLPIYHFLADMQTQGIRGGVGFGLGPFSGDFAFVPRVEFNNLILSDATWNLKKSHIEPLLKSKNDNDKLTAEIKTLRDSLKIPQYVMLADGDNELLVNFGNLTSVRMLLDTVSKRGAFKLTEFLFSESGVVKEGKEYYTNQVVVSFYNEQKLTQSNQPNE
ncbi:lantibiotic dehydratase family protein [Kordia sp.]|uniref:lantibiotic dehydratase family protein n=1 Tax=Kordia sp. TaxID=1965332 RepID=UPI003D26D34A